MYRENVEEIVNKRFADGSLLNARMTERVPCSIPSETVRPTCKQSKATVKNFDRSRAPIKHWKAAATRSSKPSSQFANMKRIKLSRSIWPESAQQTQNLSRC